jgi:outer membrane protein insertion porin family
MIRQGAESIKILLILLALMTGVQAQITMREDRRLSLWLGKRPPISQIKIEGNAFFSESKIRSHLFSRQRSLWGFLRTGSRDQVLRYSADRDTSEVKYLYIREGFLNVKITERYEVVPKDSSAVVIITVVEGSRFLIGRAALHINDSLPFASDLSHEMRHLETGKPVDPIAMNELFFNLKTVFANNGYPYASVSQTLDSSAGAGKSVINITAAEGPLTRFGRLNIKDSTLRYYSPYLVRREIAFNEGEVYSRKAIVESQRRLYTTGLFNSISLNIAKPDSTADTAAALDSTPDFTLSAIERKPHFFTMQTGASQDSLHDFIWDFTGGWGKRNIFVSRRLELSFNSRYVVIPTWRPLLYRYQISYTEPWFMNLRLPLTFTGRFEPGIKSLLQNYKIQTWGLSVTTRKEWSERTYATLSGEYENVNVYGVPAGEAAVIRQEENISIRRKLTANLVRDTRLDRFMPASGYYTTYFAQYVGGILGGDDSFIKLEYSWARYQPATGRTVYATRIKAGWVKQTGSSHSVPTEDRFYLGGANSIRGFAENSIGPRRADGSNDGANSYLIFNQELRTPLFWRFWGSMFTDLGNGWASFSDAGLDNILFSYGVGIQFISPAGPLRLDYAHRVEAAGYNAGDRFHVTILYAF